MSKVPLAYSDSASTWGPIQSVATLQKAVPAQQTYAYVDGAQTASEQAVVVAQKMNDKQAKLANLFKGGRTRRVRRRTRRSRRQRGGEGAPTGVESPTVDNAASVPQKVTVVNFDPSSQSGWSGPVNPNTHAQKNSETLLALQRLNSSLFCAKPGSNCPTMPASAVTGSKSGGGARRGRRGVSRRLRRRSSGKTKGGSKSEGARRTRKRTISRGVRRIRSVPSSRGSKGMSFKRHASALRGLRSARRQTVGQLAKSLRDARDTGLGRTRPYKYAEDVLAGKRKRVYATGRRLLGLPV